MNVKCLKCKGRGHCNRPVCPMNIKLSSQKTFNQNSKQDYFGETPNIFVGKYGYPNVNVGFLNVEDYANHDEPLLWARENYGISRIINLRSALVNSNFNNNIKVNSRSLNNKLLEMGQEIAMASKPVDMEINLEKKPMFLGMSYNQDITPYGPSVKLKKAIITENPKIPTKVDKVVSDTDLKANSALITLTEKGFDEHYLTKLLSVGNLGVKIQRKLVPTRWSITAVDDNICRHKLERVKQFSHSEYTAYYGSHLGNHYLVLFFPGAWSYELFETYAGKGSTGTMFATDNENYNGRKQYAHSTAGGYYAARLAIAEKMEKIRKQASCLCLRFISDDYWAPLGVWVVREAARNAMKSKPLEFSSKELMLKYAKAFVKKKFGFKLDTILNQSKMLKELNCQKKLMDF